MQTVAVVLCIVIILGGFSVYEISEFNEFCKITINLSDKIEYLLVNDEERSEEINSIKNIWESKKKTLYMFANHNIFKELEAEIFNIEFYHNTKDAKKELYHIRKLNNIINELKEVSKINLSNIL